MYSLEICNEIPEVFCGVSDLVPNSLGGGLFSTDYISVANVTGLVAFRLVLTGDCSCNKKAYQSNAKHLLTNSKTSQ